MSRKLPIRRRCTPSVMALAVATVCAASAGVAQAQIRTDGSVGAVQALIPKSGAYLIPQDLGKLSGANLFHSFQVFNIGSGESATFNASAGIANVISRVTGGSASQINGLLQLSADGGARPGFYFINPAGVVFGAGAAIDVPGAFHVGTADYVAFPGGRFNADLTKASSFSSAAPEAFGFLGVQRSALVVKDGADLRGRLAQTLGFAGGDLTIDNASILSGGGLRLAAVGTAAMEVGFSGALPSASGDMILRNAAMVESAVFDARGGATLAVSAGRIAIDNEAYLYSSVRSGATGQGAAIDVAARDTLSLTGGGNISSLTFGSGNAGSLRVRAGALVLDSGGYLYSSNAEGSTGNVGGIDVTTTGALRMGAGTSISTFTQEDASGLGIRLQSASVDFRDQAFVRTTAAGRGTPGDVALQISGTLALSTGARVQSFSTGTADAGALRVSAGVLSLESGSIIESRTAFESARTGLIDISVDGAASFTQSNVRSNSASNGNAAPVTLSAASLRLDNASVTSNALGSNGASGSVDIALRGDLSLLNGSSIDTSTFSSGAAGMIKLRARDVTLDSASQISSNALDGTGAAGTIDLLASGMVLLRGASGISSTTATVGAGGAVQLGAASLRLEGGSGISTQTLARSSGAGGSISIQSSGQVTLQESSSIVALVAGSGSAGSVQIDAGSMTLDTLGNINTVAAAGSNGNAGSVGIRASGAVALMGGAFVSSSTLGRGNAGVVDLRAGELALSGGAFVASTAIAGSLGNAGRVSARITGAVVIRESGALLSSTNGPGSGGLVQVEASRILLDGLGSNISAAARENSSGQVGNVQVQASESISLSNGAVVGIQNLATVVDARARQPTTLSLNAPVVTLSNALVTAASTGNVAASDILVNAPRGLNLAHSTISTSAVDGNGGAVRLVTDGILLLRVSEIGTSVSGLQGNGGDIAVSAGTLLLDTGFIQANTAARNASGGLVRVVAGSLVASGNTLFLGGNSPYDPAGVFGFNVIQAAAPTGVSGVIDLTSPVIDLTGSLRSLRAEVVDAGGLGRSLCQTSGGSSLGLAGRGGLPPSARGLQRAEGGSAAVAGMEPPPPPPVAWLAARRPATGSRADRGCL